MMTKRRGFVSSVARVSSLAPARKGTSQQGVSSRCTNAAARRRLCVHRDIFRQRDVARRETEMKHNREALSDDA